MKKNRSASAPSAPRKPLRPTPPEEQEHFDAHTLNLSPERLMEGVSTKTKVLDAILAQSAQAYPARHWGIHE